MHLKLRARCVFAGGGGDEEWFERKHQVLTAFC